MLKTNFFALILAPALSFASFSISIKPGAQAPLLKSSTLSCPKQSSNGPDDIQPNYFAVPPITLKWTNTAQSLVINAAHVTVYFTNGTRHICDITSEDVQDSLLPFYWTNDGKRTLDPGDSGKDLKEVCMLKCGGLSDADPIYKIMSALVELDGYTIGGAGPSEDVSARASFFVSAPN